MSRKAIAVPLNTEAVLLIRKYALQEMGGWSSAEMVRRYAHLAADHLAPFAERLGTLCAVDSVTVGTKNPRAAK